eukprot:TRINITY_DN82298_c0_g1_i1.p1 TRINITY_DN82298_c0_g1~~TRINITY_DN82298_c0_g1_i1.p1  ORF type:complete len:582 (+),score=113.29 TRINITY_DN82298_c0_g1_i1:74-1819(+)
MVPAANEPREHDPEVETIIVEEFQRYVESLPANISGNSVVLFTLRQKWVAENYERIRAQVAAARTERQERKDEPSAAETESTAAGSSDSTAAGSTDSTATGSTDSTATGATDSTAAVATDSAATGATESTTTVAADSTATTAATDATVAATTASRTPVDPSGFECNNPRLLAKYGNFEKKGEGAYGEVYKAKNKWTGEMVAIKKVKVEYQDEGIPSTTMREIALLKECDHQNIVKLNEVMTEDLALFLIFEYQDCDLRQFLKSNGPIVNRAMIQSATLQCFKGLMFCHTHRILHRDLKPQNILVSMERFRLKIADFGLARSYTVPLKAYTHEVMTLWYRAPEVLLGSLQYATPADVWSLGVILPELATGKAMFTGDSEIGMLFKIFQVLGTPSEENWPGVSDLRDYKPTFPKWRSSGFRTVIRDAPVLGDRGIALLGKLLSYSPAARPSAAAVLNDEFFEGFDEDAPLSGYPPQAPAAGVPPMTYAGYSQTQGGPFPGFSSQAEAMQFIQTFQNMTQEQRMAIFMASRDPSGQPRMEVVHILARLQQAGLLVGGGLGGAAAAGARGPPVAPQQHIAPPSPS